MTTPREYTDLAEEMRMALEAARQQIPQDILCPTVQQNNLMLRQEDYRALGTSLFIQAHMNGSGGNYSGPSSEKQQRFIATLILEREGGPELAAQFLDSNDLTSAEQLSNSQATSLIDTLKELPKNKR